MTRFAIELAAFVLWISILAGSVATVSALVDLATA